MKFISSRAESQPVQLLTSHVSSNSALKTSRTSQVSDAPPRPSRRLPTCRAPWLTAGDEERPRVVLVCTGSVASVKVPELVVALRQKLDAQVAVLLTEAAEVRGSWCFRWK